MKPAKNVKVRLQRATTTKSATGQPVKTWADYATVMASVKTLRGNAYYAAQQTANEIVAELFIWYRSGILADDRAIVGETGNATTYEIAAPPENLEMKNREMILRVRHVQ